MSAIVAAMVARLEAYNLTRNPEDAILIAWDLDDACKAFVRASNAAGAGRVVEGAPLSAHIDWLWSGEAWWAWSRSPAAVVAIIKPPSPGLRPTRYGGAWVWSTATHDPRPCAWPRPTRGADR